jgi:NADH:ubiquinone oxidoreductase subunit 2 (subunit N)
MSARALLADPALPVALALVAALLLVVSERRRRPLTGSLGLLLVLVPCALALARLDAAGWALAPLVAALVAAALARERPDPLPGECALKLVWVLGGAFALTAVGLALLALATGVTAPPEQWSVLQLGLSQRMVWAVALPLALLAGVVLLGGAPFHFWVADLFQGAPAALAPLAVAALQGLGAVWLVRRLAGLEVFGDGAVLAGALLRTAAIAAFLAGAGTLLSQRRPERRVGTLASLQGGLALAALAISAGRGQLDAMVSAWLVPWAAHLALALSGATLLARLTPADPVAGAPGGHLFRRHPLSAFAGLYALFSLAGVPGTPGAALWLEIARGLAANGRNGLLIALALGWLAAFATVMRELREGFGAPTAVRPERSVPLPVRAALWVSGAGLAVLGAAGPVLR